MAIPVRVHIVPQANYSIGSCRWVGIINASELVLNGSHVQSQWTVHHVPARTELYTPVNFVNFILNL